MSQSLNSLKGGYIKDSIGPTKGVIKEDTRSLDSGSYGVYGDLIVIYPRPYSIYLGGTIGFGV